MAAVETQTSSVQVKLPDVYIISSFDQLVTLSSVFPFIPIHYTTRLPESRYSCSPKNSPLPSSLNPLLFRACAFFYCDMTSPCLDQQSSLGQTQVPLDLYRKRSSPSFEFLPSPGLDTDAMAAQLLDSLLRDMESNALLQRQSTPAPSTALPTYEVVGTNRGVSLHDPPPVYERRSFPDVAYQSSRSAVHNTVTRNSSAPTSTNHPQSTLNRRPYRADNDYKSLAAAKEEGANSRNMTAPDSFDESHLHPLFRSSSSTAHAGLGNVGPINSSLQRRPHTRYSSRSNTHAPEISQSFTAQPDTRSKLRLPGHNSQPPLTASYIDEPFKSQVYVTRLEPRPFQSALANCKNWIGCRRVTGTEFSPANKTAVHPELEKNERAPVSTFASFSHQYSDPQLQSIPSEAHRVSSSINIRTNSRQYAAMIQSQTHSFKSDSRMPAVITTRSPNNLSTLSRSESSLSCTEKVIPSTQQEYRPPPPTRLPPRIPELLPLYTIPSPQSIVGKATPFSQQSNQLSALPWQHIRPPHSPALSREEADLTHVETWLSSTTATVTIARSITPPSPASLIFSDKSSSPHVSTVSSSPVQQESAELEGDMPLITIKVSRTSFENGMKSSITDWTDLDGCTPDFLYNAKSLKTFTGSESPPLSVLSLDLIQPRHEDVSEESDDDTNSFVNSTLSLINDAFTTSSKRAGEVSVSKTPCPALSHAGLSVDNKPTMCTSGNPCTEDRSMLMETVSAEQFSTPSLLGKMSNTQNSTEGSHFEIRRKPVVSRLIIPTTAASSLATPTLYKAQTEENTHMLTSSLCSPEETLIDNQEDVKYTEEDGPMELAKKDAFVPQMISIPEIPKRLNMPLSPWSTLALKTTDSFLAPSTGMTLHISRGAFASMQTSDWDLTTTSTSDFPLPISKSIFTPNNLAPLLSCKTHIMSQTNTFTSNSHKAALFTFRKEGTSTHVATSNDGRALFVVREAYYGESDAGEWVVTFKQSKNEGTVESGHTKEEVDHDTVRWDIKAIVTSRSSDNSPEKCAEMSITCGEDTVGLIQKRKLEVSFATILEEFLAAVCIL